MSRKRLFLLLIFLVLFWSLAVSVFRWEPGDSVRWVNDNNDRMIYMQRASWVIDGSVPYKDVFSEYPQIPNYLFALPFITLALFQPIDTINSFQYIALFSFFMLCLGALTITLLHRLLPDDKKDRAFLLLLPASLYFTFNRFDILPAFLSLLSMMLLLGKKTNWAAVLLGIGTMTKWYPALLLPIFLVYDFYRAKKFDWKMVMLFLLTILIILTPTYLTGGWEAISVPYKAHFSRTFEFVSLPALVYRYLLTPINVIHADKYLGFVSLFFQFFPILLTPFLRLEKKEDLLRWSCISIGFFIMFSKIYSPQWLLWLMPFFILTIQTRKDLFLIIFYDLLTYLAYPIIAGIKGLDSTAIAIINSVSLILLAIILSGQFSYLRQKIKFKNGVLLMSAILQQIERDFHGLHVRSIGEGDAKE